MLVPLSCGLRTIASRSAIWVNVRRVTERRSGGSVSAPIMLALAGNSFGQEAPQMRDVWHEVLYRNSKAADHIWDSGAHLVG